VIVRLAEELDRIADPPCHAARNVPLGVEERGIRALEWVQYPNRDSPVSVSGHFGLWPRWGRSYRSEFRRESAAAIAHVSRR